MRIDRLAEGACPECDSTLAIRDDVSGGPYGYCAECVCGWRLNTAPDGSMTLDYVLIARIPKVFRRDGREAD